MATMLALGEAVRGAGADPAVRSILITGAGSAFCTGADLAATTTNPVDPSVVMDVANDVVRAIAYFPLAFVGIGLMPDGESPPTCAAAPAGTAGATGRVVRPLRALSALYPNGFRVDADRRRWHSGDRSARWNRD